jgi:ribonuclease P/MRP protein subunit POP8
MSNVDLLQDEMLSSLNQKDKLPETTFTLCHPPYIYIYLTAQTLSPTPPIDLDKVTARSYLYSALSQFLGLTGAAIQLDLLKVEGKDIWLRVAKGDASAVVAAVSQWTSARQDVSLRVKARGTWLGAVMARGRREERLWTMEK